MTVDRISVVALCAPGPFQHYLLHLLQEQHEVLGVVFQDNPAERISLGRKLLNYLYLPDAIRYLYAKIVLPKLARTTQKRLDDYAPEFENWQFRPHGLNQIEVSNINDVQVVDFIQELKPDAIVVNGTNLIRDPLLSIGVGLKYGMINLHTGLSPYSRGGNCNLFMLLEGHPELVGGTIHYIDKGIDSGDIIHSYRPPMNADDPYEFIESKVFIEGMRALSAAVSAIANGRATRVKQWTKGKLFLRRTGYQYQLFDRVRVNKKIERGLISEYLNNQAERDLPVRLIEGALDD